MNFGGTRRCLSSAVLGGGLRAATHWLNLQVDHGYARLDPDVHLAEEALARGLDPGDVIGMLTAADVAAVQTRRHGSGGRARHRRDQPAARRGGRRPRRVARVGTINLLVVVDAPLSDAALAGAIQTATEAKAQALADAGVTAANHDGPATGTATDSICIAALPGATEPFAGPVTPWERRSRRRFTPAVLAGARARRGRAAADGGSGPMRRPVLAPARWTRRGRRTAPRTRLAGGWPTASATALAEVIETRRDIRRFRPDEVAPELV